MSNRKSIQILRGASDYDPSIIEEVLLDGQPFYSKKNHKFYIGDGESPINQLRGTQIGLDLEQGAGGNSLQQTQDQESNVTEGYFNFTDKNANATALDGTLTDEIQYGATGDFASALGGKCAAIGKRSFACGTTTIAKGKCSHAEGDNSVALGKDSHAEGYQTVTGPDAEAQHAEGANTQALGFASHAEGSTTIARGSVSHVEGWNTIAEEKYSHAEGANSKANGQISHAEGNGSIASGDTSHAEGINTVASGNYSHSEGEGTLAEGQGSHSEGRYTKALGGSSHAEGYYTIAGYPMQTTIGSFNDNKSNTIFEVGNGGSEDTRSNAFEVKSDGRASVKTAPQEDTDVVRLKELNAIGNGGTKLYKHIFTYPQYGGEQVTFLSLDAEKYDYMAELLNANMWGQILRVSCPTVLISGIAVTFISDYEDPSVFRIVVCDAQTGVVGLSTLSFEFPDDENYTVEEA